MSTSPEPSEGGPELRTYLVDGLRIAVPFLIPSAPTCDGPPDWVIDLKDGIPPLDDGQTTWSGDASHEGRRWGRFGQQGSELRIHLEDIGDLTACPLTYRATLHRATAQLDDVGLLRRLMPYLLALDGRLVLHASCVLLPHGAAVFCAQAATGKSTLALALDAAGYPLLSDDHIVLEPRGDGVWAYPSFSYIDVAQPSREVFRPEAAGDPGKVSTPLCTPQPSSPVQVTHLVFLERGDAFSVQPLDRMEVSTRLLLDVFFGASLMDEREQALRLDGAVALSEQLCLIELTVPNGLAELAAQLSELPALLSESL